MDPAHTLSDINASVKASAVLPLKVAILMYPRGPSTPEGPTEEETPSEHSSEDTGLIDSFSLTEPHTQITHFRYSFQF
jgi:hypothetical protein